MWVTRFEVSVVCTETVFPDNHPSLAIIKQLLHEQVDELTRANARPEWIDISGEGGD